MKEENKNFFLKYEYAQKMLETEVNILLADFQKKHGYTPVEHIKSRLKTKESIEGKLRKKGYEETWENVEKHIHDIVGLRIVVSFLSDVYDVVTVISKSPNIIIKEKKDYISEPKETGYTSYHLIVLVPVYLEKKI